MGVGIGALALASVVVIEQRMGIPFVVVAGPEAGERWPSIDAYAVDLDFKEDGAKALEDVTFDGVFEGFKRMVANRVD